MYATYGQYSATRSCGMRDLIPQPWRIIRNAGLTVLALRTCTGRQIGNDWFHEDDFSVECHNEFFTFVAFAIVIILLVPVGIPILLFIAMKNKKNQIGGVRMTALGGAKLADDDVPDENDTFGFLIRDLKPEYARTSSLISPHLSCYSSRLRARA